MEALQHVLLRMQSGSRGTQDDVEEERAIKQIWDRANVSPTDLVAVTQSLWKVVLQAINAPKVRLRRIDAHCLPSGSSWKQERTLYLSAHSPFFM